MRVLLTGAFGFLGAHVSSALRARGDDVLAVRRAANSRPISEGVQVIDCDLADADRVAAVLHEYRPEGIVHLAWFTARETYWTAPENLACIAQGLHLLRMASASGCRRFVGAGTCAEYDWSHASLVERVTPCLPRSLYGTAKLALGLVGERFAEPRDLSFAWARYGFLFGEDEAAGRLVGSAIETLAAGRDFACSHGRQIRDYLHVAEAATATAALLHSEATGPVNIGSGEPVALRRLLETVATLVGGPGQLRFGALPPRDDDPEALIPSLQRLEREVGWRPSRSLHDRLADVVAAAHSRRTS